ncbi:RagB/SusD family nutrient uptake outer membrane protein [Algoriphagus halophytocola]|uniref:RagB/SusD family nutrient uptake outer membrane protein n=1 Tax=Algoriphagus halophytocola TaxID=2991499 RepID=A0ABY6MH62_9BACT|nr:MULTISPECIES: RagB/SusD family nutrient uptake outer membrane protein [unclassified Algoriphagus]UZD23115.1 RagB/SusD family nutrient uptake outer membrane protein [Algoriphagus sp. TR-M5]WBL44407.1 RagB/SusD family nutrient uptake outer membrane protein [Algoriphagus sp. TR-M9]
MKNLANKITSWGKKTGIILSIIGTVSCSGFLDEDVTSQIGSDYLNSPKGLNDGLNAAYSTMRAWYGTERGNNFTIFGTDIYTNGADGSWKFMNTYTNQFDSQNGHVRELWDEFYRGINTCNAVIDRSAEVTGISQEAVAKIVAEAKFIRAHHYFIMVQLFGPLDLQLSETILPTKEVSRASVETVYAAIIADLESAIPSLEASAAASDYGRATRAAAEHLLGRVYLTKATSEAASSSDYADAERNLQSVIDNYGLELLPDFGDVHAFGNEINNEVIWSTQYTRDPLTNGGGNNSHVFFLMEYDVQPGMQRDTENGRPFKRYRPTDYTLNTIFADRTNDSRYKKSYRDAFLSNKPGTYNTTFDKSKETVTFAQGDTTMWLPGYNMSEAERAQYPYQVLTPELYTERLFPALRKQMDPGRADRTQFEGGRDYIAMRLADTYLMLAEAQLMQGKVAEATDNINVVRRRAAFPGKEAEMEISESEMTFEFLTEERARELIGEQTRWLDLKRWGILVERVKMYNPQGAPNIKDFHVLRPIPQNQIDRAEGTSSGFPQNPGY